MVFHKSGKTESENTKFRTITTIRKYGTRTIIDYLLDMIFPHSFNRIAVIFHLYKEDSLIQETFIQGNRLTIDNRFIRIYSKKKCIATTTNNNVIVEENIINVKDIRII